MRILCYVLITVGLLGSGGRAEAGDIRPVRCHKMKFSTSTNESLYAEKQDSHQSHASNKRIHVSEKDFRIKGNRILVRSKNGIWEVKSIHVDHRGFFVFKGGSVRLKGEDWDDDDGDGERRYECSRCGKRYYSYNGCDAHIWGRHRGFGHVKELE
jgi:hypothetical protein